MASPSVTYTFANSTTADATQVNQNFTDIINGATDGTKDYTLNAITTNGTATLNGAVTLGQSSLKDLVVNASLASNLLIKTNNTYNIGSSTLGLAGAYFGSTGTLTTRVIGGATGSSWTLTLPTTSGTSRQVLQTDGSGVSTWQSILRSSDHLSNYAFSTSVSSSAMTINLLAADGTTPGSTNLVDILFRNVTSATGTPVLRTVSAALNIVISSGATLGHVSSANEYVHIYALDNAGTVELAVAGTKLFDDMSVQSTSPMSGSATSARTLYSTSARSSVPIRYLGRLKSNQSTAGTYASNSSEITSAINNIPVITPWKLETGFTPSAAAFGTVSNQKLFMRRVGDTMEVMGFFTMGTVSATAPQMTIPSGFTIDYNKLSTSSSGSIVGWAGIPDPGASSLAFFSTRANALFVDGSNTNTIWFAHNAASNAFVKDATNGFLNNNCNVTILFMVPILEWHF